MASELFIENRRADISQEISNLITYSIDDIKDVGSRNTSFSKTIVLPGTANNNALLGHIFSFTVVNDHNPSQDNIGVNFNPGKQAECVIFQDHIQVFKGIIRVMEIIITNGFVEYECTVFGELGGLTNSLGSGKLQDLDFSAYDHALSVANIQASWDNINGSGYFYPLADYGNVSSDKVNYDYRAFRPALFVKEYIDKIFAAAGYTYESDLFDSARFKSLIIPNNLKEFKRSSYNLINASRGSTTNIIDDFTASVASIPMSSWVVYLFTVSGSSLFTFASGTPVSTSVQLSFYGTYVGQGTGYKLALYKNGVEQTDFTKNLSQTFDVNTHFYNWVVSGDIAVTNGDTLELKATATGTVSGPDNLKVISGTFKVDSYTSIPVDITLGNTVPLNELLPRNVLQKDFLTSIVRLYNLYVYDDKFKSKHVKITPYVDFYDTNVSGIVDWTYKMDRGRQIRLTPMSLLNSRFYDFKFKPDTDYYNELYKKKYGENYGDYLFDSEFAFEGDRTEVELIFSGTPLVGYAGLDKMVSTYYKQAAAGIEQETDVNIRILQAKKITGVSSWSILDDVSVIQSGLTNYGYAGHYDDPDAPANDIHFGVPKELFFILASGSINVTQFNVYWSPYMAEISDKDSKLLTAYFKLSNRDISNLDFSKLVYIDGSYFRLNKIIDWNASDLDVCKCELLRVINTVY